MAETVIYCRHKDDVVTHDLDRQRDGNDLRRDVLFAFLLEVLERRTALLTSRTSEIRATLGTTVRKRKPVGRRVKKPRREDRVEEEPPAAEEEPAPQEEGAAVLSALDQARHRAERRTRR